MAKRVSAMILEHDIPVFSDFPVSGGYPSGIFPAETAGRPEKSNSGLKTDDRISDTGIYIGYRKYKPFPYTLQIIPRIVSLGIGCRKGTAGSSIKLAVRKIAELNSIDIRSIKGVYSIDIKAEEPGIVEFCSCMGLPFETYSAQQLMNVKGTFESSDFVKSVTGADNVCERAAACGGGSIIVQKKVFGAVTAALAADDIVISFRSRL